MCPVRSVTYVSGRSKFCFFDYSTVNEQVLKTCFQTILYPSLQTCYNIDNTYIVGEEAP
jgi:hypothetical protein